MPQLLGPNGGPVRLYERKCTLDVGQQDNAVQLQSAFRVTGLRVAFKILKSDKPEPNSGEIQIWNLNEQHRAAVELEGTRCVLSAGYQGSEAQIFSGQVRFAQSTKAGQDWVTKLELGDGHQKFRSERISHFFQPGTKLVDVVMQLGKLLVEDTGNLFKRASDINAEFSEGYTVHGRAADELTRVLAPFDVGWSIQDGRIEALGPTEFLSGEGPLLSPDSGLIGSPTYGTAKKKDKNRYLHVKSLLQPGLRPGQGFQVKSKDVNGAFRCHKVEHQGDIWGTDWLTEIQALPRR
jgi:hypothetical protein